MDDSLHSRGKALEDLFFSQRDQELLAQLKQEMSAKEGRTGLASASGIDDEATLEAIAKAGITPETMTSVSIIPLVAVAWADKRMEAAEKEAILKAAGESGVKSGTAAYSMIESWLDHEPSADLLNVWKEYMGALKGSLDDAAWNQLKSSVLGKAEAVAAAAGGFLGVGSKISDVEKKVLSDLSASL